MLCCDDKRILGKGYTGGDMSSAATKLSSMISAEVGAREFCARMASAPALAGLSVQPRQLLEVLGGIANLYDEKALEMGLDEFHVNTSGCLSVFGIVARNHIVGLGRQQGTTNTDF